MGLKCSVIGHKYGEAAVEREREEQGSEVVITIQERETCERCGKTRIVSENKEVTAIETPSDIAGDMIDDADEEAEDGDLVDETEAEPAADEESDDLAETAVDAGDPDADDAEIVDDGDEESAGGDSELENPSTEVAVGEAEESKPPLDADEAAVASDPESDDGVIIDGESEETTGADRKPGEWPAEPDDGEDDWAPETAATESAESEDGDGTQEVEPVGGSAVTVPSGQFRCPECEFTTDVASSSLRAGDFCPECHKGALVNTGE
jgi:ssDNA-binding Zn-finger/Zn-ribbon topoisomerase 1